MKSPNPSFRRASHTSPTVSSERTRALSPSKVMGVACCTWILCSSWAWTYTGATLRVAVEA